MMLICLTAAGGVLWCCGVFSWCCGVFSWWSAVLGKERMGKSVCASAAHLPAERVDSNRYGRLRDLRILSDFAFVEFDDDRDADDAVHYLDGYELDGSRLIVEHARIRGERKERRPGPNDPGTKCFNCGKTGHW